MACERPWVWFPGLKTVLFDLNLHGGKAAVGPRAQGMEEKSRAKLQSEQGLAGVSQKCQDLH